MSQERRQEEILQMVARDGEVTVDALVQHFGVSDMTVRRDLGMLSRAGRLSRTHGGAVLSKVGIVEFSFQDKQNRNAELKDAIAREAAKEVAPGMAVLFDTGTTTLAVARAVAATPRLTVLTTSLMIASALHARPNIDLVLLGGVVRKGSPDLSGPLTEENLAKFRVNIAFLGADGVCADGVFTDSLTVAKVSRAMMASARRVVLTIDSSKFAVSAFAKYADWSEFDCVVTDAGTPAGVRGWLAEKAKQVTYVEVEK